MAPAQTIAQQSQTGAATNIIHGLATGMASTWIPTILLALAIYLCNSMAGMYGICVAAVSRFCGAAWALSGWIRCC
jgi:K(+)-stimulated pyrophosphate-energized sodium pump